MVFLPSSPDFAHYSKYDPKSKGGKGKRCFPGMLAKELKKVEEVKKNITHERQEMGKLTASNRMAFM